MNLAPKTVTAALANWAVWKAGTNGGEIQQYGFANEKYSAVNAVEKLTDSRAQIAVSTGGRYAVAHTEIVYKFKNS